MAKLIIKVALLIPLAIIAGGFLSVSFMIQHGGIGAAIRFLRGYECWF